MKSATRFSRFTLERLLGGILSFAALEALGQGTPTPTLTDANWIAFGTNFSSQNPGPVRALAVDQQGTVYAGTEGGYGILHIARLGGDQWTPLPANPFQSTNGVGRFGALAVDGAGSLYVGGWYMGVDTDSAFMGDWAGSSWLEVGGFGPCFVGIIVGGVQALAVDPSNNAYAAGRFCQAYDPSGVHRDVANIAKWNGTNWSALGAGPDGPIYALAVDRLGNVYAGGAFSILGSVPATNVAKWDGSAWSALGPGVGDPLGSRVNALSCDGFGNLYAGGSFTNAGSLAVGSIARWDGTRWSDLGTGTEGAINALAIDPMGNVYVGGTFTKIGGAKASNVARWDGQAWSAIGSGVAGYNPAFGSQSSVNALAFDSAGNLYVGGTFTVAGNQVSTWLAKALLSPQSYGLVLALAAGGTNVITGSGTPGVTYMLEATTNLVPPVRWTPVATNTPTGQALAFTALSTGSLRFYRVRSVP